MASILPKLWKITIFNGKIHYKWSFSIAMLNYQRVITVRWRLCLKLGSKRRDFCLWRFGSTGSKKGSSMHPILGFAKNF
jgi:hypothetical protein